MANLQKSLAWIIAAAFLAGAACGGAGVHLFERQSPAAVASANPLLTADRPEFNRLVPFFFMPCGQILFEVGAPKSPRDREECLDQIKVAVFQYNQVRITNEDVLDPRVRAQWHKVMRGGK